mmetsp:Transcript_4604/g.18471  ORF Transcript_4604/g.18471 Transcript_4604/m.18471 type:complete len:246 (-) Transcript_4604:80-817(-)
MARSKSFSAETSGLGAPVDGKALADQDASRVGSAGRRLSAKIHRARYARLVSWRAAGLDGSEDASSLTSSPSVRAPSGAPSSTERLLSHFARFFSTRAAAPSASHRLSLADAAIAARMARSVVSTVAFVAQRSCFVRALSRSRSAAIASATSAPAAAPSALVSALGACFSLTNADAVMADAEHALAIALLTAAATLGSLQCCRRAHTAPLSAPSSRRAVAVTMPDCPAVAAARQSAHRSAASTER